MNATELLSKLSDHEETDVVSLNTVKFITMASLFVISMTSGMIPYFLSRWFDWSDPKRDPRANLLISSLLSFGGGALLCTTLMHLLPEIDEIIAELQSEGRMPAWEFSITNLLMAVGFFIIYLVEEVVHAYLRRHQKKSSGAFLRGRDARESLRAGKTQDDSNKASENNGITSISTADLVENEHVNSATHSHNHHQHSHIPAVNGDDLLVSSIRGLLIVLALSVHELFEGLAVGLESTNSNVWYMFGSVSAHKVVIAFCIGVELMVHKTKTWLVVLYIFVYAIVSPLGMGVGIWLSSADNGDAYDVASVILQGLAAGTLLYVIFFEILSKHKDGIVQYAAVVVGFFLMFGLKFIGESKLNSAKLILRTFMFLSFFVF